MASYLPPEDLRVGNGTETVFGFTFPYLHAIDVALTVDDVAVPVVLVGTAQVSINPAPALGAQIRIYRNTPAQYPQHLFATGVPMLPKYIDENNRQLLYSLQEGLLEFSDTRATAEAALAAAAEAEQAAAEAAASAAQQAQDMRRTVRVPTADPEIPALPPFAARANKVMGFDASGNPVGILPATGSGTELAIDLANQIDPAKGGGMIGVTLPDGTPGTLPEALAMAQQWFSGSPDADGAWRMVHRRFMSARSSTLGRVLLDTAPASVFEYMTEAERTAVQAYSYTVDVTVAVQKALDANVYVYCPPGGYLVEGLRANLFGHSIVGAGNKAYGGGTVFKTKSTTVDILTISKPTTTLRGIVFWGMSDPAERGEDVFNAGVTYHNTAQKDIDGLIADCAFVYLRDDVRANGTNILFDGVTFSNSRTGLATTNAAGWENRGFIFSPSCRFHSIGKTGAVSGAVTCVGSHNVMDVMLNGCLADDTATVFRGFASGLWINGVTSVRCRGNGIILDATGHGIAVTRRQATITAFNYQGHSGTNATLPTRGIEARGLMSLVIDGVTIGGCGGPGLDLNVSGQVLRNATVFDVSQSADNTYDGIIANGAGQTLQSIHVSQDANGVVQTNKGRRGINFNHDAFIDGIVVTAGFRTARISRGLAIISGDLPPLGADTPGTSWAARVPTSGRYLRGHIVYNTSPSLSAIVGAQYHIYGWRRLTDSNAGGTNHSVGPAASNPDWCAMNTPSAT